MLSRTGWGAALLAGACVALAITFVQVRGQNREAQDATQRELRELRELREAMQALRSQVGQTQRVGAIERAAPREERRADEPAAPRQKTSETSAATATAATAATDDEGELPRSFSEALQRSEEAFRDEAIDAAWAGAATNQVQGALAKLLPSGATVRGLSCHSTRCRLEMNLRDESTLDQFQRAALYGSEVLWRGQLMIDHAKQADGTIAMVAHLIRERGAP